VSAAARRSISVGSGSGGGGAAWAAKSIFSKIPEKISFIYPQYPKNSDDLFLVIKALRFADEQTMLAGSESDLQIMMGRLNMVSVNYNMKINTKNTKVMRVRKGSE